MHVPYRGRRYTDARLDRQPDRLLLPTRYDCNPADRGQNSKGDCDLFEESPTNPAANFEVYSWYAFFLPKGTPVPIVQKLHEATSMATANISRCID